MHVRSQLSAGSPPRVGGCVGVDATGGFVGVDASSVQPTKLPSTMRMLTSTKTTGILTGLTSFCTSTSPQCSPLVAYHKRGLRHGDGVRLIVLELTPFRPYATTP